MFASKLFTPPVTRICNENMEEQIIEKEFDLFMEELKLHHGR